MWRRFDHDLTYDYHPNSSIGAGGPGRFRTARFFGADDEFDSWFSPSPLTCCVSDGSGAAAAGPEPVTSLSADGLAFIARHEGYRDKVYLDSAGKPTIGYGHLILKGEDFSNGVTEEQASQLLAKDVKTAVDAVNRNLKVSLTQTQFDALVDFTYNLGGQSLSRSTLLRNINAGKSVSKENFTDWNHAGGKVVEGLTRRRTDEWNLFSAGTYGGT